MVYWLTRDEKGRDFRRIVLWRGKPDFEDGRYMRGGSRADFIDSWARDAVTLWTSENGMSVFLKPGERWKVKFEFWAAD